MSKTFHYLQSSKMGEEEKNKKNDEKRSQNNIGVQATNSNLTMNDSSRISVNVTNEAPVSVNVNRTVPPPRFASGDSPLHINIQLLMDSQFSNWSPNSLWRTMDDMKLGKILVTKQRKLAQLQTEPRTESNRRAIRRYKQSIMRLIVYLETKGFKMMVVDTSSVPSSCRSYEEKRKRKEDK